AAGAPAAARHADAIIHSLRRAHQRSEPMAAAGEAAAAATPARSPPTRPRHGFGEHVGEGRGGRSSLLLPDRVSDAAHAAAGHVGRRHFSPARVALASILVHSCLCWICIIEDYACRYYMPC